MLERVVLVRSAPGCLQWLVSLLRLARLGGERPAWLERSVYPLDWFVPSGRPRVSLCRGDSGDGDNRR